MSPEMSLGTDLTRVYLPRTMRGFIGRCHRSATDACVPPESPPQIPRCDTATTQVTGSTAVLHRDCTQRTMADREARKRERSTRQRDCTRTRRKEDRQRLQSREAERDQTPDVRIRKMCGPAKRLHCSPLDDDCPVNSFSAAPWTNRSIV
jgi:hypothetical protein